MDPKMKQAVERYFKDNAQKMVEDICKLVRIPSTRGEPCENMPYGIGPYTAMKAAEEMLVGNGLKLNNYDNRVITGDMTDLPAGLDILAHLDVVPCEDNWTICKPYEPVLIDGALYGRGTMDDKGPAVAALYAMKCVKELGLPLKRNVRLILGTDEECGSGDVEYYYSVEAEAPMTFTPDASFPLINLEKGRLVGELTASWVKNEAVPCIAKVECGYKSNVIPETASVEIRGLKAEALKDIAEVSSEKNHVEIVLTDVENGVMVRLKGVGAHAAYPEGGNNALTAMVDFLASISVLQGPAVGYLQKLHNLFPHGDYYGKNLGIAMSDDISGPLTCSSTILTIDEHGIYYCFDARCPVCSTEENTKKVVQKVASDIGMALKEGRMTLPHYVPADSDFVKTLLKVYESWTGLEGKAESTGGGTYVHELKNGVAFGCETVGIDNRIHGADEFITLEQLILSAEIFTEAIIDLCC